MIRISKYLTLLACLRLHTAVSKVPEVDLADLDGTKGLFLTKSGTTDHLGYSVSYIKDLNGDDIEDIIVGVPKDNEDKGAAYVIYGSKTPLNIDLSDSSSFQGFKINGISDTNGLGASVSRAGDVNGDKIEDLIIGAPNSEGDKGAAFVIFGKEALSNIDLSIMDNSQGFKIVGLTTSDKLGASVSQAGDINGDGFDDIIIGAPDSEDKKGAAYIIYGTDTPSNINLSNFKDIEGFKVTGGNINDKLGTSVSKAGDLNGDGKDDIVIGAPGVDASNGAIYLVLGKEKPSNVNLNNFDSTEALKINGGSPGTQFGYAISQAGDFNGDGKDDIIVGAPNIDGVKGDVYVIFGGNITSNIDVSNWDITQGFSITCSSQITQLGNSVNGAGDINGDGIEDIIIGTPQANENKGGAYVIYGTRLPSNIDLDDLKTTQGYKIIPSNSDYNLGQSVSTAGDFNGDGFKDIILASPSSVSNGGAAYIIYGTDVIPDEQNIENETETETEMEDGEQVIPKDPHDPLSPVGEGDNGKDEPLKIETIKQGDSGLSIGIIIGIVIGGIIVAASGIAVGIKYSSLIHKGSMKGKGAQYKFVIQSKNETPNASSSIKLNDVDFRTASEVHSINQV